MRVLEINDAGIRICDADSVIVESPGVAALDQGRVITGDAALKLQRLAPRNSHDRFWYQLDAGLDAPMAQARRAADLAHLHLTSLGDALTGQALLVGAPASFSTQQLSLLLGLLKAAGASARGLFDPAVASASDIPGDTQVIHIDIQLHRFCVTVMRGGSTIERVQLIEHKPGLRAILDRCASVIARAFVNQSRFDPLHSASTEQTLHDALPGWLHALNEHAVHSCELDIGGRVIRATAEASDVREALRPRLQELQDALDKVLREHPSTLLLSERVASIPGMTGFWPQAKALNATAAARGALEYAEQIVGDPEQLKWIAKLPRMGAPEEATIVGQATHVLIGNRALALPRQGGVALSKWLPGASGRAEPDQAQWQLEDLAGSEIRINGQRAANGARFGLGDRLEAGGHEVRLIEVAGER